MGKPQEGSQRAAGTFPGKKSCSKAEQKATPASLDLQDTAVPLKGLIAEGQDAPFNISHPLSVLVLVPKSYPKPLEVPTAPTAPSQHPKCLLLPAIATRVCHLQTPHMEMREMGQVIPHTSHLPDAWGTPRTTCGHQDSARVAAEHSWHHQSRYKSSLLNARSRRAGYGSARFPRVADFSTKSNFVRH